MGARGQHRLQGCIQRCGGLAASPASRGRRPQFVEGLVASGGRGRRALGRAWREGWYRQEPRRRRGHERWPDGRCSSRAVVSALVLLATPAAVVVRSVDEGDDAITLAAAALLAVRRTATRTATLAVTSTTTPCAAAAAHTAARMAADVSRRGP